MEVLLEQKLYTILLMKICLQEETKPELEGYEGQVTELGAVNVRTGIYTGRSPKDKFIVMDENSKDTVWWTSDESIRTIIIRQAKNGQQ